MFAHLTEDTNVEYLCRVKHGSGAIREIARLPMMEFDTDISLEVSTTQTNEVKLKGRHFIQTGSKNGKINSTKTIKSR